MTLSSHITIGMLGESIVSRFLKRKGFTIIERNHLKKWGEIDIIAEKKAKLFFIEVKSVSTGTIPTPHEEGFDNRPEENVHVEKMRKLGNTIQTYLMEKKKEDREWQFDVAAVFIDQTSKRAGVRMIENVIIGS